MARGRMRRVAPSPVARFGVRLGPQVAPAQLSWLLAQEWAKRATRCAPRGGPPYAAEGQIACCVRLSRK
ncbi:hypothetical protein XHV734_0081 [Xanthomonas hortorum pv. vitians]|nr:hypothetical protein XHV734_0081 [Xanthomonas hortorum pv. vitians]